MKLPLDVRCLKCGQIFCCSECRQKHELVTHKIEYECSICRFQNLKLDLKKMSQEFLEHVSENHLPLGCKKCDKVYSSLEDLQNENDLCKTAEDVCHEMASPVVLAELVDVTPKDSLSPSSTSVANIDTKIFDYLKLKLKEKSEVMTSTPTHPSINKQWNSFQKSFTSSTISGIHSPNSEVVHSPPIGEEQKQGDVNSPSELLSNIESPPNTENRLKGIISKESKMCCIIEDLSEHLSGGNVEVSSNSSQTTPQDNSSIRKKCVTFADQVLAPRRKTAFEFLRPRRTCTPGKLKQSHIRTPRFQAIINNFEAKSSRDRKYFATPRQTRSMSLEDTTPTNIDTGTVIMGRAIQFKQESPTLDSIETSPVTSQEKNLIKCEHQTGCDVETKTPFDLLSPLEKDITNLEHYKSCIESPEANNENTSCNKSKNPILPELIARSIQETLDSALNSQDYTTEIQLSIKITKKTVSVNEKKKVKDQEEDNNMREIEGGRGKQVNRESTTIWSRLVSGLKWVVWGEDGRWNYSPKGINKAEANDENKTPDSATSSSKRKRTAAYLYNESPVSKRYRGAGRIYGRRPLDRVLRDGVMLPERCHSNDVENLRRLTTQFDDEDILNKSF